ncbi:unnamed protein product, partial [Nesidiocoris tenuis]
MDSCGWIVVGCPYQGEFIFWTTGGLDEILRERNFHGISSVSKNSSRACLSDVIQHLSHSNANFAQWSPA